MRDQAGTAAVAPSLDISKDVDKIVSTNFDTSLECGMLNLFRRNRLDGVSFCERCSPVCDERCRADAVRDRAHDLLFQQGWRLA